MPGNPIKEFFQRRKAEVKFARAGPGKTLSSSTSNPSQSSTSNDQSSARQAAAEAAMKRFSKDSSKPAQRPRITPKDQPQAASVSSPLNTVDVKLREEVKNASAVPKELPIVDGVAQRDVQVFTTEELAQRMKQPDIDDDFFKLTVEDAKLFKQRYEEEKARNEILRTSEMRRREAEAKRPTTNISRLRFKLPNSQVIEASFSGDERLSFIREWLITTCKDRLSMEMSDFDILFGFKPLKGIDYSKSVKELGLIPATTLTVMMKSSCTATDKS